MLLGPGSPGLATDVALMSLVYEYFSKYSGTPGIIGFIVVVVTRDLIWLTFRACALSVTEYACTNITVTGQGITRKIDFHNIGNYIYANKSTGNFILGDIDGCLDSGFITSYSITPSIRFSSSGVKPSKKMALAT